MGMKSYILEVDSREMMLAAMKTVRAHDKASDVGLDIRGEPLGEDGCLVKFNGHTYLVVSNGGGGSRTWDFLERRVPSEDWMSGEDFEEDAEGNSFYDTEPWQEGTLDELLAFITA